MRIFMLIVALVGGACLGGLAHWQHPFREIGVAMGTGVGLLTFPLVCSVLRHRNIILGVMLLYLPAAMTALCVANIAGEAALLALGLVLAAFAIGAGLAIGFVPVQRSVRTCAGCGYDKEGLPSAICPECGVDADPPRRRPRLGILCAVFGGVFLVLCPMVVSREERRQNPQTCEEAMVAVMGGAIVIKERGVRVLARCGPEPMAVAAAQSGGWTRQFILERIGLMSPTPSASDLIAMARSENPKVRAGALLLLDRLDSYAATDLARLLVGDEDEMVRSIAQDILE